MRSGVVTAFSEWEVTASTTAAKPLPITAYYFPNFDPTPPEKTPKEKADARRWVKRVAKRRRRKALAKHHRRVLQMIAAGHTVGFPKRPPK